MSDDRMLAYDRILQYEIAMTQRRNKDRMQRYTDNRNYYSGDNLPPDNVSQPLSINYIQSINNKHVAYLWGEYKNDILKWAVDPLIDQDAKEKEQETARKLAQTIENYIFKIARRNNANLILSDVALNASICGDGFVRMRWDAIDRVVKWESVPPEYVHVRWNGTDVNQIEEIIISYPMLREEAFQRFGTRGNISYGYGQFKPDVMLGMCIYWERWTPWLYQIYIDDQLVTPNKEIEGPEGKTVSVPNMNPMVTYYNGMLIPGFIPIEHFPNFNPGSEFYGYADAENGQGLQDELNRKMADEGDIINLYAHPITILRKYYGNAKELPVGPDVIWDMGREGEASLLTWTGTPPSAHEYTETVREILLETTAMSSVAYGRHKGSQQSAIALAIEMMPITERVRAKRMIWDSKLRGLLSKTIKMQFIKDGQRDIPFPYDEYEKHFVKPIWASILPRDRLGQVQENIALAAGNLRSIRRALEDLGEEDSSREREEIFKDKEELAKFNVKAVPPSGSSSMPEGPDKATLKGKIDQDKSGVNTGEES